MSQTVKGYEKLDDVLARAYRQASAGKGVERHAAGEPFHEQPMQTFCQLYGVGFALGQAAKKLHESQRLPRDRAVAELLGAINYIAGAVIFLEQQATEPIAANDNAKQGIDHARLAALVAAAGTAEAALKINIPESHPQ